MKNRMGAVKATQAFCEAFNRHEIGMIGAMLDDTVVYSQQNVERSLIGKASVVNRLKSRFEAMERRGKETAETAIVDLSDVKAHPCLVVSRNGAPVSLVLLEVKINNRIRSITVLTNPAAVAKARITSNR